MNTRISTAQFKSAKQNMEFDKALAQSASKNDKVFRIYTWEQPGITISYKQNIPDDLKSIDHATRVTGGGLVFHSAGDIVLSFTANNSELTKGKLKEKMKLLTDCTKNAFRSLNIELNHSDDSKSINHEFCTAYPNPFELYLGKQKILALTLRKYKQKFIIQGIIHLNSNTTSFKSIETNYKSYFTEGLSSLSCNKTSLKLALIKQIKQHET
ncbi:lipoate--protein ligase family protein [bacterium]|jgi:lipoate-protein ligase A|nr:lipoate--protein ligase family protein [bacterium]